MLFRFSIGFVVAKMRAKVAGNPSLITVKVSTRPSRTEADALGRFDGAAILPEDGRAFFGCRYPGGFCDQDRG